MRDRDNREYRAARAALEATRWDPPDSQGRTWRQPPTVLRPWAAEPLDDCDCGCGGEVQRLARHHQGLGELWGTPLGINTHDKPMGPRLPGPGPITLALDAVAAARGQKIDRF